MLPAINIATAFTPTSLVATAIPDTSALRVPADNVAPSVSSVSIDLNASANSNVPLVSAQAQEIAATTNDTTPAPSLIGSGNGGDVTQSAFIAQLVSQEIPAGLRSNYTSFLSHYEELVANSFVKYKPSNAGIPQTSPADLFQQAISEPAPQVQAPQPQPTTEEIQPQQTQAAVEATRQAPAQELQAVISLPQPQPAQPLIRTRTSRQDFTGTTQLDNSAANLTATAVVSAYAATTSRNAIALKPTVPAPATIQ